MTKATTKKVSKAYALPPVGAKCQECVMGSPTYIPCSKPAVRIVSHGIGECYQMCEMDADHNVKNRGARYVHQGEPYTITMTPSVIEAMKTANAASASPVKSTTGPASGQAAGKSVKASASADKAGRSDMSTGSKGNTSTGMPAADLRNAKKADEVMDFDDAPVTEDQLTVIRQYGERQLELLKDMAILAAKMEVLSKELSFNKEVQLPAALTAAGMEGFKLSNGFQVAMRSFVNASIPKDLKDMAHEYLDKLGGGAAALIKRTITIRFGKGDDAWAKKFLQDLNQRKKKVDVTVTESVHSGSLTAWVKERDAENKTVNEKLLGVFRKRTAEVVVPKDTDLTIPV